MGTYTLDQAQRDVAALRGQIAHLQAYAELLQVVIDTSLTLPDGSSWSATGLNELILTSRSTPSSSAGNAVAFANGNGQMTVVDGTDSQVYTTQRRTLNLGSNSGNITSLTPSTIQSSSVGNRTYRVHGQWYITAAGACQFGMEFSAPASTTGQFNFFIHRSTTFVASVSGGPNSTVGAAVSLTAATYTVTFDGLFVVPGSGTLAAQAFNNNATSSYTVNQFSFLDIMPV